MGLKKESVKACPMAWSMHFTLDNYYSSFWL